MTTFSLLCNQVYKSFTAEFPVVTIEDPFDQDDWASYTKMTESMGNTQVCACVCQKAQRADSADFGV